MPPYRDALHATKERNEYLKKYRIIIQIDFMKKTNIAEIGRSGLSTWKYQFSYDH